MEISYYLSKVVEELSSSTPKISNSDTEEFLKLISTSANVFLAGAGRSGLMAKSFAMRLMHMGIRSFVVGESTTPSINKHDLLIICSGSGETKSLVSMAEKAKSYGASVAVVTISPNSTIGEMSDLIIKIPAAPKNQEGNEYGTIQPMGSLFEQTLLLFFDSIILRYMEIQSLTTTDMYTKHANLE
ncbi:6-phospho-3-hexuloisomerase [Bacillus sp. AFS040349]|uniref:6-phospho-3-hexuloisomerase n=1 Tax=Bacillus sp. AFS040349 TaxID=2033502 RepID=UPI000BFBFFEE|nr:6-phospho-3-hexuloisomerase [Bacillus sp. AFS040349]PGT76718.1 6-phospho-3-hexuloisomerase [Bacillus sp. AFS040349]